MAVLKCHYFQWLHKTTELGLVASGIVAAQSLIENQSFSTFVKGAQQITEHRAEPHWVEGLLVRDASEITFIYLPDFSARHMLIIFSFLRWIVSSAQLERRQKDIVQDFRKTSKTTKPGLGGDKTTTKGSTRPFCQLPPGGHFGGVGENMIWSRTL